MTEPEVSLRIAMHFIQSGETLANVSVSIDGAHIKTKSQSKEVVHFDINTFMRENGYFKCDESNRWQGEYQNKNYLSRIVVTSKSGIGDILVCLNDGNVLYIESKKFKKQGGGEYPAIHEAIGQLMTGCPYDNIPVVAVPYNDKSAELAERWSRNSRICNAGIRFMLVHDDGAIDFI